MGEAMHRPKGIKFKSGAVARRREHLRTPVRCRIGTGNMPPTAAAPRNNERLKLDDKLCGNPARSALESTASGFPLPSISSTARRKQGSAPVEMILFALQVRAVLSGEERRPSHETRHGCARIRTSHGPSRWEPRSSQPESESGRWPGRWCRSTRSADPCGRARCVPRGWQDAEKVHPGLLRAASCGSPLGASFTVRARFAWLGQFAQPRHANAQDATERRTRPAGLAPRVARI